MPVLEPARSGDFTTGGSVLTPHTARPPSPNGDMSMAVVMEKPFNLGRCSVASKSWAGVTMHSIDQQVLPGRAWHEISSDTPLLSIIVGETGGHCEALPDIQGDRKRTAGKGCLWHGHVSLIPAGYTVWGYSDHIERVQEARLVLSAASLIDVMGDEFPEDILDRPRLMFVDEQLQTIGRLLASECAVRRQSALFGDGLMTAVLARLAQLDGGQRMKGKGAGLTPRQLASVTDYVAANLARTIRLSDLAPLAGLSQSQFGRAFKASTGMSPHQWHLDIRLAEAKHMLANRRHALVEIALATGFSEQSHFARVFKAMTGMTPGAWRRAQLH